MVDIDTLPIPDWGLHCPHCGAPLAGMPSHNCARCGKALDLRQMVATLRPIPPVGLACPHCGYSLTGLTRNRCPECGRSFYVRYLLERYNAVELQLGLGSDPPDCHVPKRAPVFTGRERPLPDFGLYCPECEQPLAGATGEGCPGCGATLDLLAIPPGGEWADISYFVPAEVASIARRTLYGTQVPYMVELLNHAWHMYDLQTGSTQMVGRLQVPRVYFLDAMHALTEAATPDEQPIPRWNCPHCGEQVPAGFEICWKCDADFPGLV